MQKIPKTLQIFPASGPSQKGIPLSVMLHDESFVAENA